jgi:hypothetical protein
MSLWLALVLAGLALLLVGQPDTSAEPVHRGKSPANW